MVPVPNGSANLTGFITDLRDLYCETPVVELPNTLGVAGRAYAKLEKFNPAGSIKDRVAVYVLNKLERDEQFATNRTIVESSSGNLGIALAMLGAQRAIRVIIVVDPNTSPQNLSIMRAYGAEIIVENALDDKGLYHKTKLDRARRIAAETGGYWVNQTANVLNADAHAATTGPEILRQCGEVIEFCLVATSSGGQIAGIARAIKAHSPSIRIVAVDVVGSQIFSSCRRSYETPGLGLSWQPVLIEKDLIDYVCLVDDAAAFETARFLARQGILVGPSSGAVAAAVYRVQKEQPGASLLGVFPDGGERYLATLFDDEWMARRGFSSQVNSEQMLANLDRLQLTQSVPQSRASDAYSQP